MKTFAPHGLIPVRRLNGRSVGALEAFQGGIASGYATAIGKFDPVKMVTAGGFELAAAGEAISAIFSHVEYTPTAQGEQRKTANHWPASQAATDIIVYLWTDLNDLLCRIAGAGPIAATARGDAADWVAGTLNTRTGWSGGYLGSGSLAGAGNSAQLKIRDLWEQPGNEWGDAFTEVLVTINERNLGLVPGNAI